MSLLLFCALIGSAFSQSSTEIEGTWSGSFKSPQGMSMTISWTFIEGSYTMDMGNDGTIDVKGKYEISENLLYTWDLSGRMACPDNQKGSYTFSIKNDKLKVVLVEDVCPGRSMISPQVEWTKD